jgi:hypothetical protein
MIHVVKFYIWQLFFKEGFLDDDELHWAWLVILHMELQMERNPWHDKAKLEKHTYMHKHTIVVIIGITTDGQIVCVCICTSILW